MFVIYENENSPTRISVTVAELKLGQQSHEEQRTTRIGVFGICTELIDHRKRSHEKNEVGYCIQLRTIDRSRIPLARARQARYGRP
jgi:hypothetical protein